MTLKTTTLKQQSKTAHVIDDNERNVRNDDAGNADKFRTNRLQHKDETFLLSDEKRTSAKFNYLTSEVDAGTTQSKSLKEFQIDRNEEEVTITELVRATTGGELMESEQNSSMRVALGIILRLVLPLANGVVRGIQGIRDVRFLRALGSIVASRQALTGLIAFAANTISMNLSAVQVSYHIDPILKLLKLRKSQDGVECLPDNLIGSPTTPTTSNFLTDQAKILPPFTPMTSKRTIAALEQERAPKCCTLNILAEPPPGEPIRADIVLIHGLHGSLVNTWKQGLWEKERRPVEFQRPPKPPVRPPKRPRHSRALVLKPPQKKKRARYAELQRQSTERDTQDESDENAYFQQQQCYNDFSYICGEPEDIKICEGVEYSFPTFRLRMNDKSRLLQTEFASTLNKQNEPSNNNNNNSNTNQQPSATQQSNTKLTPNDPNYSKCWPGDWLPLDCPGVRVIAVNYTTDQYLWRPLWKKKEPRTNLVQRAREMAELLIKERVGHGHPIIWVGHSKGGLFVKQIIVDAWESGRPAMAPFWRSARGVFFYSVPHRGSHLASVKAPLLCRSVELIDIEKNSKYLLDLHRRFAGLYHLGHLKIEVFSFVETALTLMSVLYLRIVGVDSADPGIGDVCGIRLDHREICKPRSRDCILYRELVKMIQKVS